MKTSPSQIEMLVAFMEQHGDLCKLSTSHPRGRITTMEKWEELAALLNSDGAGATRTTEKWKKVWSDLKNNTKKKAARLHRAARGTGGGPAIFTKLTHIESKLLNLIGTQVATGLTVEEAGLLQDAHIHPNPTHTNADVKFISTLHEFEESQSPPRPSLVRAISSPPLMFLEEGVQRSQPIRHESGPSTSSNTPPRAEPTVVPHVIVEAQVEETGVLSPTRPSSGIRVRHGLAPSIHTTRRARRTRGSPRRQSRTTHTEQAAQHFLQADTSWRNFKEQQHKDIMELKRERNRIRVIEVEAQRYWGAIGERIVNVLERIADKYCKD